MAYLKQIEGVTAPVRVDSKPSYGSYVKTSATDNREVYKDGEWYEETGGELVTNGTFDTDVSGWAASNGATLSVDTNRLKVLSTLTFGRVFQSVTTVVGKEYTLRLDVNIGTSSAVYIWIGTTSGNNEMLASANIASNSTVEYTFIAESTVAFIQILPFGAGLHCFADNISVFKSSPTLSTLPLPPQSYIEDSNGQLVEFEVIDGQVVDTHTAGYVPAIVENKVVAKEVSADVSTLGTLSVTDGFDLGQKWVDVTASRSVGVTYTNTTGKPIQCMVKVAAQSTALAGGSLFINNVLLSSFTASTSNQWSNMDTLSVTINPNEEYHVTVGGSGYVSTWSELR